MLAESDASVLLNLYWLGGHSGIAIYCSRAMEAGGSGARQRLVVVLVQSPELLYMVAGEEKGPSLFYRTPELTSGG